MGGLKDPNYLLFVYIGPALDGKYEINMGNEKKNTTRKRVDNFFIILHLVFMCVASCLCTLFYDLFCR